jgi:hypothetical protein
MGARSRELVMNPPFPSSEDTFRKSSFFEQLAEHVFISEILQERFCRRVTTVVE